jgi:predicted transcriptional regulator
MGGDEQQLTDVVREEFRRQIEGVVWRDVLNGTGVPFSCLHGFLAGGGIRTDTLHRILHYIGWWKEGRWTGP